MIPGYGYPMCTLDDLQTAVTAYNNYTGSIKHLLGVNEPYLHITAADTAIITAKYYMPLAAQNGWAFVSPTTNIEYVEYFAEWMKYCLYLADDEEYPCDYKNITAVAIHDYSTCNSTAAEEQFGTPNGAY